MILEFEVKLNDQSPPVKPQGPGAEHVAELQCTSGGQEIVLAPLGGVWRYSCADGTPEACDMILRGILCYLMLFIVAIVRMLDLERHFGYPRIHVQAMFPQESRESPGSRNRACARAPVHHGQAGKCVGPLGGGWRYSCADSTLEACGKIIRSCWPCN